MKIEAEAVSWQVNGKKIIEDINLSCPPGTFTGLLGPNGSGKTTLLHVMAALRKATHGRVLVDGRDLHRVSGAERAKAVALVEQDASTNLDITVHDVVALGRIPHRGRWAGATDDTEAIERAMEIAKVAHLADRRWPTLSGGERQRTHLARAVAQQSAVLLLDEPTNHLDLGHQLDFLTRVRQLGLTTVAALHDLELALGFCDRLVVLDHGHVVAAGSTETVLTRELIADVYGVDATVEQHPLTGRPHLRWNGPIEGRVHG